MLKKQFISISFISLIASNILLITSSSYHSLSSELLGQLPFKDLLANSPSRNQKELEAKNKILRDKNTKLRAYNKSIRGQIKKVTSISRRIAVRTARNITLDLGSLVAEATPYIGVGFIVMSTSLDIKDGCDTIKDVNEIIDGLGEEGRRVDESQVCGIKMPETKDLLLKAKENIGGTLYEVFN